MEGAVQQTAELGDLNAIPKKLDDRLAFLDREPNSENTRLAIADARRQALDELKAVQGRIEERWGVKLEEARKKMLEPVEPADRLRASTIWAQIPAGLDQTNVDASWPMMSDEVQTALLSAPAQLVKTNGVLEIREVVSDDRRADEMARRRPDAAAQLSGIEQTTDALRIIASSLEVAIKGGR